MTEARLAARLIAVGATPASVRDQADPAIPARPEALLRRPRHRRHALRPRAEPAAMGAAGQCRQEYGTDRTREQAEGGTEDTCFSSPLLLVSFSPCLSVHDCFAFAVLFLLFGTDAFPVVDHQPAILDHERQRNDLLFYLRVVNRVIGELIYAI